MTTITYLLCDDGGFVARCDGCGCTSYAYPTSVYASQGVKLGDKTARIMLASEHLGGHRDHPQVWYFDQRNTDRLNSPKAVKADGFNCTSTTLGAGERK